MVTINRENIAVFRVFFKNEFGGPNFFFNKSVTLVSRNISGKFKKNLSTQFFRIKFRLFWQFLSTIFFLFFHHEILKYVSTHVQIFRLPYRTRFGNNHGFISRGQSFSHSTRSMNWHARTCFRRRISRKTRLHAHKVFSLVEIIIKYMLCFLA
jgi:hypothetical protein